MQYITTKDAAKNWGISQQRVIKLAGEGRIDGAKLFGINWMIPRDAQKPIDKRTKLARVGKNSENDFRFPIFMNKSEDDFIPALSDEERLLRKGQAEFYACRFDASEATLSSLFKKAQNRYVRISALFHLCYLSAYKTDLSYYNRYIHLFNQSLDGDFPYKQEMLLMKYQMDKDFGNFSSLTGSLYKDNPNEYHPSACDTVAFLSIITLVRGEFSVLSKLSFDIYEVYCLQMERAGHFLEAQQLHYLLLEAYQIQSNNDRMEYHLKRGLEIAMEHKLYYRSALFIYYYPTVTSKVLSSFPLDFSNMILSLGKDLHDKYVRFENVHQKSSYWGLLSEKEFVYITYAVQGYSNKQVSQALEISEKSVSKKYNKIYDKLGVNNKQELVELIKKTQFRE